jgi:hypothetical protein
MSVPYFNENQVQEIDINESNLLNKIKNLQNIEKNMYNELVDPKLTPARGKEIVDQINRLSDARVDLYENLKNSYSIVQDDVANTRGELVNQKTMINFMEDELNKTKKDLQVLEQAKFNKLRMVEINTYNANRYGSQVNFVKGVLVFIVVLFILRLISVQSILPVNSGVNGFLMIMAFSIFGIWAVMYWYNYFRRSNMNWNEYNWYFDQDAMDPTVLEYDLNQIRKVAGVEIPNIQNIGCIGQLCCSNDTVWDAKTKKCIGGDLNKIEHDTNKLKVKQQVKQRTAINSKHQMQSKMSHETDNSDTNKEKFKPSMPKPSSDPFSKIPLDFPVNGKTGVITEIQNNDIKLDACEKDCLDNKECKKLIYVPGTGCLLFNDKAEFDKNKYTAADKEMITALKSINSELYVKN